jgi:hypothetical protein
MWPFSIWRKARQKAFLREAFSKYLSPGLLEQFLERPETFGPLLKPRRVIFALLQVRDDDGADLPARLRHAVEIAGTGSGIIDIMPPLVLVSYGYPLDGDADACRRNRAQMVDKLLRDRGSDLRIVVGEADGLVGNLGSERRFCYGAAIPGFSAALQKLMTLEFGVTSEVRS